MSSTNTWSAVGIAGSPSPQSKSRTLLRLALDQLEGHSLRTTLIDLNTLSADALLGRRNDHALDRALTAVASASIIVVSTPVYRATYSGLLKVFFDLFPHRGLVGKIGIAIATGGAPGHQLVIDHGLTPLFASVGAVVASTGVYATDAEFVDGNPHPALAQRVARAATEAATLTGCLARSLEPHTTTSLTGVAAHA